MTVFKRGNGWGAKFQQDGQQHWVPGGPWRTKREARAAEVEHRHKLARPLEATTCREWAERWPREWPRPAESTRENYERAAKRFAKHFGDQPLVAVTRVEAREWCLSVSRGTRDAVRAMLEDARNVGLIDANPFAGLRLPATGKRDVRTPSLAELDRLLAACEELGKYGELFHAMIRFAAWSGLRAGELFALRWEHIGPTEIHVLQARKKTGYGLPKNGLTREVVLLPPAREALEVADAWRRPHGYIWHAKRGGALGRANLDRPWLTVRTKAGLSDVVWHSLRHFCASRLLDLGLSPYDVALHLGHTDGGKLVIERYGHPDETRVRRRIHASYELGIGDLLPAEEESVEHA